MKIITLILFIGIGQFVAYIIYAIKKIGSIPRSISKTYYLLEPFKKSWMFQISLIALGFMLLPRWIEVSSEWSRFLCFLSAAGIIFVGAAARFLDFDTGKIHIGATILTAAASIVWTCFAGKWFWIIPIVCCIAATVFILFDGKNKIFYYECGAFLSAFLSIILSCF